MPKPNAKLFAVKDNLTGASALFNAETRQQALNAAIGSRFTVTVPTSSEAVALVQAGAAVIDATAKATAVATSTEGQPEQHPVDGQPA